MNCKGKQTEIDDMATEENKKRWNWRSVESLRAELSMMARSWVVPIISLLIAFAIIAILLSQNNGSLILKTFRGLRENLPLTLPILSVLLSITEAQEIVARRASLRPFLRRCNFFASPAIFITESGAHLTKYVDQDVPPGTSTQKCL